MVVGWVALAFDAWGEPVRVARALAMYEEGQLSQSLVAFEDALRAGGNGLSELETIYLHLGILRAGSRDAAGAEAAFLALCTVSPTAKSPRGASPVVRAPFERAKKACASGPKLSLTIDAPSVIDTGASYVAVLRVDGDPAKLVAGARADVTSASNRHSIVEVRSASPITLAFPRDVSVSSGELRYHVELIDAYGSVLLNAGSTTEPRVVRVVAPVLAAAKTSSAGALALDLDAPNSADPSLPPLTTEASTGEDDSIFSSPWFWAGTGVVAIGAAVIIGVVLSSGSGRARFNPVEVQ